MSDEAEAYVLRAYGIEMKDGRWVRGLIPHPLLNIIRNKQTQVKELDQEIQDMLTMGEMGDSPSSRMDLLKSKLKGEIFELKKLAGMCLKNDCEGIVSNVGDLL